MQGLRQNWLQFTLLVIINGFVGGMIGLERTLLPLIAKEDFGIAANSAILSFIVVFGITKAITNYYTGKLANQWGRRRLLIAGWLIGLPVPLLLMYAPTWSWVIITNIFLGVNQGLTWSSTVVMKIELVGERQRGLAMGLNESVGYLAVGIVAFLTGWMASNWGIRPYPFVLGLVFVFLGLILSWLFVKDTREHVSHENKSNQTPLLKNIFNETSWQNPNLGSISQAGLINNLNDGMIWGLFPVLLAQQGFDLETIGKIVAVYPLVWGLGQLFTGRLSDLVNKKRLLFYGMFLQGMSILLLIIAHDFLHFIVLGIFMGIGTAMVYPTFLAAMSAYTHPSQRAESIGVFRLWRDLGYAVGAILTGLISDLLGISASIVLIGLLTLCSSLIIHFRMLND